MSNSADWYQLIWLNMINMLAEVLHLTDSHGKIFRTYGPLYGHNRINTEAKHHILL